MNKVITFLTVLFLLFSSHQIFSQGPNFEFHKISNIRNGYKVQSNGSPQELWVDPQNPEYLHAIFINSQYNQVWPDRKCIYFGSTDLGESWLQLGAVPDTSRAGFPVICGTSDGEAIITDHSGYFGSPSRSGLFIDNSPFEYNFNSYDPGAQVPTSWPECLKISDDKILLAATATGPPFGLVFNTFDIPSSTFSGWSGGPVSVSGTVQFSMAISEGGTIGFTYIDNGLDPGDVFYFESTDQGVTWSTQTKIFDCPSEQGIAIGALTGISLNFYQEFPCVVFETCQQDFNNGGYYPRMPNQILFWSPNVNGGNPKVIADSSNVPFAPSLNPSDVFPPLSRPVIGRSDMYNHLFVAFSAATENVFIGTDSVSYFAGYFMWSQDGGNSWILEPTKFTPDSPLLDWKYISIAPVNPWIGNHLFVHVVVQSDSLEVQGSSDLGAQYYHAWAWLMSIGVYDDLSNLKSFQLSQNYPNPFNPSTKIKYSIPQSSNVIIKVFDVLGNEIETIVNEEKSAGEYEVEFNAVNLPSGIYFYKLHAGNFVETKKMILLK